jgi:CRISPR type IV-associated protein Csf3
MKTMQYPLDELFDLQVVDAATASSNEKLHDKSDDLEDLMVSSEMDEWIADASHLDVVALVEEQMLLSLPLVARHEDESRCITVSGTLTDAKHSFASKGRRADLKVDAGEDLTRRPFANLRELLNK